MTQSKHGGLMAKVSGVLSRYKFQMIPFENTPENAREILKNLGKNN